MPMQLSGRRLAFAALVLLCVADAVRAQATDASNAPAKAGTRRALIVCGHPGDDAHRALFAGTIEKLHKALAEKQRFAPTEIRVQFGGKRTAEDGPAVKGAEGDATREAIETEVADLRKQIQPDDTLWVIVLGHTHYDGRQSFLNLAGPDLRHDEFGKLFKGIVAREQVFFITTPASGFFIKPLSTARRVIITATEADREVNETQFPHALAEVLANPPEKAQYDADGDGTISLFDLYIAVARNIAAGYAESESLSTEHAQLDDNGDGKGSELQLDYLPPEQGGRASDKPKPKIVPPADGALALGIPLDV